MTGFASKRLNNVILALTRLTLTNCSVFGPCTTRPLVFLQIKVVFLYWLPCILRMHRPRHSSCSYDFPQQPGRPGSVTADRKPLHFQDVELKERSSKSLLANVLDIDDDFRHNHRGASTPTPLPTAAFFGPFTGL